MKTSVAFAFALMVGLASCQDNATLETAFGPFENNTHQCDFDCSQHLDIALILDASGSIQDAGKDNWDRVINFTIDVIDNFDIGPAQTHLAIVTFSTRSIMRFNLHEYMTADEMKAQIMKNKKIWYIGGWTNTYEALEMMQNQIFTGDRGDRPFVHNVAIVVTDGKSSFHERPDKYKDPIPMARQAEAAGTKIYVVGVTNRISESELQAISLLPRKKGQTYWTTPSYDNIREVMKTLLLKTCKAICFPKELICKKAIDLVFVIDSSGSIQRPEEKIVDPPQNTNWWLFMGFIKNIIDKFTISEHEVHMGVVTFSNLGIARVKLNTYFDAADLKAATNDYGWFGDGDTNTWDGLNVMRREIFNPLNGDRENVQDVAIVLTDGKSSHLTMKNMYKDPIPEANLAKKEGVKIFGVGVTTDVDTSELEAIASVPPPDMETVFITMDFESLSNILRPFLESLMTQVCFYPSA